MKKMLIFGIILVVAASFFIGDSIRVSNFLETWSVDNLKEPNLEKVSYYNIKYMDMIGNFDRTLELIDKFTKRYADKSPRVPEMVFLSAQIYGKKIEPGKARDTLKYYIDTFPDAKNVEEAKRQLSEYKF